MDVAIEQETVGEVRADLGFSQPAEMINDHEGRGLKRAVTRPLDTAFDLQFERRSCRIRDWSTPGQPTPELQSMGFEAIDLGRDETLQTLLAIQNGHRTAERSQ